MQSALHSWSRAVRWLGFGLALVLLLATTLAACEGHEGHDPYLGSWQPVNGFVRSHEMKVLVIHKAQAGYEATIVAHDGTATSVQLTRRNADLVTVESPAQGGFALQYEANSGLFEYVQPGAAPIVFRKT